jgi:beta-glucanase (GH16 family)
VPPAEIQGGPLRTGRLTWLAALGLISAAALASAPGTATAATTDCGAARIAKPTGGYWNCTFGDDFGGTSLNPANWGVMSTATMGFTQAGECYVDDPAHVSVGSGMLTLSATKSSAPQPCGWFNSQYRTGLVFTKDRFAQTYGRYEVRARFPRGPGFQSAFWMWPQNQAYGESSGEIDVAEYFGSIPTVVSPHTHIKDWSGADHGQGAYCRVNDADGAFHRYVVEWLPTSFKFIYDGVTCLTISSWDPPDPLLFPQPFDQPFFMILQLATGYGVNAPNPTSPFPARFRVDYVRAWS